MPEGVEFPFPSLLFYKGARIGQPEVSSTCSGEDGGFANGGGG